METSQKNKWIRNLFIIAIILNGIFLFTFQSEVVIGEASVGNETFLYFTSITIEDQVYWVSNSDKDDIRNVEMAYVYKYTVLMPNFKVITKIKPLDGV